jgi:hypothetical protein
VSEGYEGGKRKGEGGTKKEENRRTKAQERYLVAIAVLINEKAAGLVVFCLLF